MNFVPQKCSVSCIVTAKQEWHLTSYGVLKLQHSWSVMNWQTQAITRPQCVTVHDCVTVWCTVLSYKLLCLYVSQSMCVCWMMAAHLKRVCRLTTDSRSCAYVVWSATAVQPHSTITPTTTLRLVPRIHETRTNCFHKNTQVTLPTSKAAAVYCSCTCLSVCHTDWYSLKSLLVHVVTSRCFFFRHIIEMQSYFKLGKATLVAVANGNVCQLLKPSCCSCHWLTTAPYSHITTDHVRMNEWIFY